ncbi:hypothetical protein D5I55_02380 [Chakrabartia godavariana]|nr:hypothetical protein D5I55_02380 [Chakrabartia godavariana]
MYAADQPVFSSAQCPRSALRCRSGQQRSAVDSDSFHYAWVKPDYIVCLEDGKKLKMLKRHLNSAFGMTPAEYREKWGLPDNYPMVAPNYVKYRAELARKIGLGRKPGTKLRRK